MADDKFPDSQDESDESTPKDPRGAELAKHDLPDASGELAEVPAELTADQDIVDPLDTDDDDYVDDPETDDINEAKLDRATDEAHDAADESVPATRRRARATAPVRKGEATRTRKEAEAAGVKTAERTTPAKFVAESVGELRKVVWPTGTQVQQYFVVVLVFVLFIMTFVSLLDLGFGWVVLKLFG